MKIKTTLLTCVLCLGVIFAAHAQKRNLLSINESNIPLSRMITAIESRTDHTFFINDGKIDTGRNVSLSVSNVPLNEALDKLFAQTPYSYSVDGKQIIVFITPPPPHTHTVTGVVTGEGGEPLVGALVTQAGTSNTVITDGGGGYSIKMGSGADELNFSFLGYVDQRIALSGRKSVNVTMAQNIQRLDNVVVVGYGTALAREVTSSIAHVSGSDLTSGIGGATIATALQGKISGLTISGSSSPNSDSGFQLRGVASINASKGPLVVIDGIPGGSISALQQADIESVDVLKDASAGAIYGTRAAGGVILITTKRAKAGTVTLKYLGEFSTEAIRKKHDLLTAQEFVEHKIANDYGSSTNWYDALLVGGNFSHKHTVTLAGGIDKASVYASFGASDQKGVVVGDSRKDYNARINAAFKLWDGIVDITINTNYRRAIRDTRGTTTRDANGNNNNNNIGDSKGLFNMAMILNPTIPMYYDGDPTGYNQLRTYVDKDGKPLDLGMSTDFFNPLADINLRKNQGIDQWLQADATMKVNITPKLSVQGTFGYQSSNYQQTSWTAFNHRSAIEGGYKGRAGHMFSKRENLSTEAYANYTNVFARKHRLNAVAGWSFYQAGGESFGMGNSNFSVEGVGPWNMADGSWLKSPVGNKTATMSSNKLIRERLLSVFGRVNYSFDDRYMVSASVRREASSKFGALNRWGTFWAVSAGWRISSEPFMKNVSWIDELKIRAGYGVVGNNGFGGGNSVRTYQADSPWLLPNGEWVSAYGQSRNIDPSLKWEEKGEFNAGIDISVFDNRLWAKFDIYKRNVKDLLFSAQATVPPMVQSTVMRNIGTLSNTGWELEIGGDVVRTSDINYSTTIRVSHNKSKINKMGGQYMDGVYFPSPGAPGYGGRLNEGSTIGQFYVYRYAGVDDGGHWQIYDKDNNVVPAKNNLKAENKVKMGNAIPKVILSWDHNFRWKNLDVGLNLRSWIGHDVFSQVDMYYGLKNSAGWNVLSSAFGKNKHIEDGNILTDYFIQKGSFLKIDAIYLGYTLHTARWIKYLKSARFYLTVRDALVLTGYKGLNPEVDINGLWPGFELINSSSSMYPQTVRFTFGVDLTF